MKTVAIIVLNWNQPALTTKTISSLRKITAKNFSYHIYLIDNGSADNSFETFKTIYSKDKYISIYRIDNNLGFVGGNNFGISQALIKKYNYYLLLNNDVEVKSDFLEKLINYSLKNTAVGLLGPKIYFAPGFEFHHHRYQSFELGKIIWFAGGHIDWNNVYCTHLGIDEVDTGQYNQINTSIDYLTGCCLLIKSEVIKKIGTLDKQYYLYLEDADYCHRSKLSGFDLAYIPESVIWHYNSGSSTAGGNLHHYFMTRNRLIFGYKYTGLKTKFALFRDSVRILFTSKSNWQKTAIIDYYLKKLGKGSWQ